MALTDIQRSLDEAETAAEIKQAMLPLLKRRIGEAKGAELRALMQAVNDLEKIEREEARLEAPDYTIADVILLTPHVPEDRKRDLIEREVVRLDEEREKLMVLWRDMTPDAVA